MSFTLEEDECEEEEAEEIKSSKRQAESDTKVVKKIKKDPTVDTSFLPDREREEEENRLREELRQEWAEQQQKLKEEEIDITFSYWDGSGHRRTVRVKKGRFIFQVAFSSCLFLSSMFVLYVTKIFTGNSVYQFLQKVLELLRREFSELKTVMADQLMYVKEDLILPHHYTFYDFIVTKVKFLLPFKHCVFTFIFLGAR